MNEWFVALEATSWVKALRNSVWIYPLVNTGHLLGIALLLGAIIPLDLRLLKAWPSVPLAPLWQVLTRTAAVGLVLAVIFGGLLFATRATEYVVSNFFIAKMVIVSLGTLNALVIRVGNTTELLRVVSSTETPPLRLRIASGVSLIAWLAALTLGRLVGYF